MNHLPVNRLLAICCLLLLTGLPFSCTEFSRILEEHCCVTEKANFVKAQNAYNVAAGIAGQKANVFALAATDVGADAANLVKGTITLVNADTPPNLADFVKLSAKYDASVAAYNRALGALRNALDDKYAK